MVHLAHNRLSSHHYSRGLGQNSCCPVPRFWLATSDGHLLKRPSPSLSFLFGSLQGAAVYTLTARELHPLSVSNRCQIGSCHYTEAINNISSTQVAMGFTQSSLICLLAGFLTFLFPFQIPGAAPFPKPTFHGCLFSLPAENSQEPGMG